jgi:hypothetical protein
LDEKRERERERGREKRGEEERRMGRFEIVVRKS